MSNPINLVLCWHMHQPYYRDGLDETYHLPWVYLHGIKDYDDMAAHLERHEQMKAVINFAPVLLEQIDDYVQQMEDFLNHDTAMADPMLNWLSGASAISENPSERYLLMHNCKRINQTRMVDPYPRFQALMSLFGDMEHESHDSKSDTLLDYLDEQYFIDTLVWYHLSWCSHNLKQNPFIQKLINKGGEFTLNDRRRLLQTIQQTLASLIPRYRALAEKGQIELSMTPWGHPIVPLLNDFKNMRDAQPDAPTPAYAEYPDGSNRSRWHLKKGLEVFKSYFGQLPKGVWLSEGGISADAVKLLDELDIGWTASGETVWHHSCVSSACDPDEMACRKALFMPYKLDESNTQIFFRDDGLSDLIGFEYSKWHADDAVANFMQHMENIGNSLDDEAGDHVVSVILDGENAWEYYPDNGHYFLDALYQELSSSAKIRTATFSNLPASIKTAPLSNLVAGSWVYGSFSTWIGETEKNHAWDLLVEAKLAYDKVMHANTLSEDKVNLATEILGICEGSDWFWWFGDYNPAGSVKDFDQLYRHQLKQLYCALQLNPPASLDTPLSKGGGQAENAGTMRRN